MPSPDERRWRVDLVVSIECVGPVDPYSAAKFAAESVYHDAIGLWDADCRVVETDCEGVEKQAFGRTVTYQETLAALEKADG